MSARVYFMKRVKDCKDVDIMSPQDEHKNRMQSKHKQTKCEHNRKKTLTDYSFLRRYHYTKSKKNLKRRYHIRH